MSAGVPFAARRKYATVVELADTPDLESGAVKSLSVQIRSVAPKKCPRDALAHPAGISVAAYIGVKCVDGVKKPAVHHTIFTNCMINDIIYLLRGWPGVKRLNVI